MIRVDIITGFPRLVSGPLHESMLHRAQALGHATVVVHDLREYATDKHRSIDDTPYGGGAGMVLKPEPVFRCIAKLKAERPYDEVVYLTADGEQWSQARATEFSLRENLILLCGHYKGVDERIREHLITREVSIGDYVLTGGELPALVVLDSVLRLIPGVLHDGESLLSDSFQDDMLGAPQYTRPAEFEGLRVPEVLLSGNHADITAWRESQQQGRTERRRKDLLREH